MTTAVAEHGHVSVVIFGASGDLARKKLYPALCSLYYDDRLPQNVHFIGFGRSKITVNDIRSKCEQYKTIDWNNDKCESFWQLNSYCCGNYENVNSFEDLDRFIIRLESGFKATQSSPSQSASNHRLFYLAIPPNIYESVASFVSSKCQSKSGWNRIIIEKPFGRDLLTYEQLSQNISKHFSEENIFRIDHYLGKEMIQNLLTLRFANRVFDETWNNKHIASVLITFKESIDIENRGGYFDNYGIIRDVLQNHLMQIFTLIAMDKPDSVTANDIRRKKLELLASVEEANVSDAILGQYVDYCQNKSIIDKNSRTATYAAVVLRVRNLRWAGVPFILKCGKALNERKTEIRIRYKDVDANIFADHSHISPNEFVILVQPDEAMYLKFMTKVPGIEFNIKQSELDLTYKKRFVKSKTSEAYERLILEVLHGSQTNFVCSEELHESWRILTPLLQQTDEGKLIPYPYERNSRGPIEADNLVRENGYTYSNDYEWNSSN